MKHTWKVALAVAVLAGSAGVAKADLTLDGQTGLFINPTAQVARQGNAEVQANYQRLSQNGDHANEYGIGGAVAVADKLELSANYNHLSADEEDFNDWRVGGKYQLLNQRDKGFDLAVGGNYERLTVSGEHANHYNAYVAGTKAFSQGSDRAPIKGTLGLRWDQFNSNGEGSTSRASVYVGAEVPLSSTGEFSLIGEVGSKIVEYGSTPYAVGVRYHPQRSEFSVGAGFGRPSGFLGSDVNSLFVQASYKFGK